MVNRKTDKKLLSKDETIKTESKFKLSENDKEPSPITGVGVPFIVETYYFEDDLKVETYLQSKVI